ncbi:MAG: permease [Bacteroidaceae bacterium]|nr:permease [Bacteroidaceae bacterium]
MHEIIDLMNEMSPYLLLGFLLAGLMRAFVPTHLYHRYLGKPNFRSVVNAMLLSLPVPLCSCGVIPTAMSLHRQGASKGASVSFLIATPQTGIDSIIATYSLMGLPFALMRPLAAIVTSLLGGQLVNWFDKTSNPTATALQAEEAEEERPGFRARIRQALNYAFVEMMQDIGRWLVLGLIIAGLITAYVPDSVFALLAGNTVLSILVVLVCAVPMYLCATGSIPIAVALMLKGLSPGTALVLLMAGPAVNVASMLVVRKVMGLRTLLLYLLSIVGGAIGFALTIDYLLPRRWFTAQLEAMQSCCHEHTPWFNIVCSVLLLLFLIHALWRRYFHRGGCGHEHCHCHDEACHCHSHEDEVLKLHITGMSCNHCRANVERAIKAVPGVESVEVNLTEAQAIIRGKVSPESIRQAVESIGFGVED